MRPNWNSLVPHLGASYYLCTESLLHNRLCENIVYLFQISDSFTISEGRLSTVLSEYPSIHANYADQPNTALNLGSEADSSVFAEIVVYTRRHWVYLQ